MWNCNIGTSDLNKCNSVHINQPLSTLEASVGGAADVLLGSVSEPLVISYECVSGSGDAQKCEFYGTPWLRIRYNAQQGYSAKIEPTTMKRTAATEKTCYYAKADLSVRTSDAAAEVFPAMY